MKKLFSYFFILTTLFSFATQRPVPTNYATIQLALNACSMGDTVVVQPGVYLENLTWPNVKNVKLFSAGDSSNTIIDANYVGRCITIINSIAGFIDTNTVISGFKLRNGYSHTATFNGVAIYVSGCKPMFKNLAITNCNVNAVNNTTVADLSGGVVYIADKAIIKNCNFYNNNIYNSSGSISGGIIAMPGYYGVTPIASYGHIYNTKFYNNKITNNGNNINGALINGSMDLNKLTITNNTILDTGSVTNMNLNGLIYVQNGTQSSNSGDYQETTKSTLIANNSFSSNAMVNVKSMGLYYSHYSTSSCIKYIYYINNVTVADNKAITNGTVTSMSCFSSGAGICTSGPFPTLWVYAKNCIFYNPASFPANEIGTFGPQWSFPQSTLLTNPQFVSTNDHHLQNSSPAINSGIFDSNNPTSDIEFTPITSPAISFPDIGCYEMNQPTNTLSVNTTVSTLTLCEGGGIICNNNTPNTTNCYWSVLPNVGTNPSSASTNSVSMFAYSPGTYTINVIVSDNANAVGSNSFIVTVFPKPTPIITISGPNSICSGQSLSLTVNSTSTLSSYLWSTGATSSNIVITPTISTTYTVSETSSYSCVATASAYINVSICTGLNFNVAETGISIYPNPNNGVFIIENNTAIAFKYEVLDLLGQLLYNGEIDKGKKEIQIKNSSKGLYFLRLTDVNAGITIKKIIVQ